MSPRKHHEVVKAMARGPFPEPVQGRVLESSWIWATTDDLVEHAAGMSGYICRRSLLVEGLRLWMSDRLVGKRTS